MTETKPVYQEASKETVENLIGNFSKTIEDLHKKVVEDISVLKDLNADVPQLLRLAIELRMNMRFILIDLMTSLRGCLKGTYTFEKCYHIKNLEGIRVEGCRLLLGYGEGREESNSSVNLNRSAKDSKRLSMLRYMNGCWPFMTRCQRN